MELTKDQWNEYRDVQDSGLYNMYDPNLLSLVPPLLAIMLAIATRQVIISLSIGIWVGYCILESVNPVVGLSLGIDGIVNVFDDAGDTRVLIFTLIIGGLIATIEKVGGVRGFIYLLESKKVKFILHTDGDPEKPMRNLSKFSYNKEDLIGGESRSRYGPSSPLDKFHEALKLNEPFAFVGKPCDVSAIRQLSKIDDRVDKYCKYLLTLVCGGFAEFTKSQDFIESFKVKEDELSIFRYRGFGNPGKMYIKTKDGREHDREYNSFWGEESTWRVPFRCKICPDAIGESSDIAALDTWRGGSPKGEDEGFNAAIVRTKKGLDLFNEAAEFGYIKIGDELKIEDINDFQPHQVNKKIAVYARHQGMKKKDIPTISTNRLRIKELYDLNSKEFNLKEEEGISSRIKKI